MLVVLACMTRNTWQSITQQNCCITVQPAALHKLLLEDIQPE